MKKYFTKLKINRTIFVCASVFVLSGNVRTQVTIYSEDFQAGTVTSINNFGEFILPFGESTCGKGTYASGATHNSTGVNFNTGQNPTFFLAVNPEDSCGGFYYGNLSTDTMNFAGRDSIHFSCDYFKSNTLAWGPGRLRIIFDNSTITDTLESEFTTLNNWDNILVTLPASMISTTVTIHVSIGGGEGVGLDNLLITGFGGSLDIDNEEPTTKITLYPNPASDYIMVSSGETAINKITMVDLTGKLVYQNNGTTQGDTNIQLNQFSNGIYIIGILDENGHHHFKRIVVRH